MIGDLVKRIFYDTIACEGDLASERSESCSPFRATCLLQGSK
ncbi:hypothetical protein LEP1GSC058_2577 [Leptospira fainei serovar Hurstbridge str. BUT 6]|uniref:Uncharacterized protein n=1 Tax=Leptospira fainei serovar Hurstbridge str. BUT 6 TaxID=1193011 RepID=S3W0E2_9LEPT|nr:hypothetical protein LEP1GSC058_2577 [Leptospira fainei serovar Hurstbridge str. BUT 6]